jgi:hypothetical protein
MATSSFEKQFYINKEKVDEFIEELTKETQPTLTKEFKTRHKSAKEVEELLQKALGE